MDRRIKREGGVAMSHKKAEVFLTTFDKYQLGHDIRILAESATVEDMLEALSAFALQYLADCRGCDGCCHERVPLTAPDVEALAALLPGPDYPAQAVCTAFADINVDKAGIIDITLKRDADGACVFLHKQGKYCRNWQVRPFVCRSHFCLPKSERLIALRSQIANRGENELIRRLLAEENAGAPPLLQPELPPADYPLDQAFAAGGWDAIRVKEITPEALWQLLKQE